MSSVDQALADFSAAVDDVYRAYAEEMLRLVEVGGNLKQVLREERKLRIHLVRTVTELHANIDGNCKECNYDEYSVVSWPCPTLRAIGVTTDPEKDVDIRGL